MCYKDWTVEDWKKVIWPDESSLWVGAIPRRHTAVRNSHAFPIHRSLGIALLDLTSPAVSRDGPKLIPAETRLAPAAGSFCPWLNSRTPNDNVQWQLATDISPAS
jgi:hypothetical protein